MSMELPLKAFESDMSRGTCWYKSIYAALLGFTSQYWEPIPMFSRQSVRFVHERIDGMRELGNGTQTLR